MSSPTDLTVSVWLLVADCAESYGVMFASPPVLALVLADVQRRHEQQGALAVPGQRNALEQAYARALDSVAQLRAACVSEGGRYHPMLWGVVEDAVRSLFRLRGLLAYQRGEIPAVGPVLP